MKELRLGIIGLSDGNGHPYSWAAIFNGYNPRVMMSCPFPVIPEYLGQRSFPDDAIPHACVTHVWTQSRPISEHVAAASKIEHVVDDYHDMIGEVDAILLARDDAESHLEMSRPFLEAGLPIYIDKPIALSYRELEALLSLRRYPGQIFSCSAMRYARELMITDPERQQIGDIQAIFATTPKKWVTYAVHIIEPVLLAIDDSATINDVTTTCSDSVTVLTVSWSTGIVTSFAALGKANAAIQLAVYGNRSSKVFTFSDTFAAFRSSLVAFTESVRNRTSPIADQHLKRVVELIEWGVR